MGSTNKKGKLQIYCFSCNKYYVMDDDQFNWLCPHCGSLMYRMRCTRCGKMWLVRSHDKLPSVCANPACHSPYWNRTRRVNKRTGQYEPVDKKEEK